MQTDFLVSLIENEARAILQQKQALEHEDWIKIIESLKQTQYHGIYKRTLQNFPQTSPTQSQFLAKALDISKTKPTFSIKHKLQPAKQKQHQKLPQFILNVEKHISSLLSKFNYMKGKDLFERLLKLCKIQAKKQFKQLFYQKIQQEVPKLICMNKNSLQFRKFLANFYNWFVSCRPQLTKSPNIGQKQLSSLLNSFKQDLQHPTYSRMNIMASELFKTLEEISSKLDQQKKPQQTIQKQPVKDIKQINEVKNQVFSFYAKQSCHYGKSPTFEKIGKETSQLNVGAFLKIFRDFKFIKDGKDKTTGKVSREMLVAIFAKNSFLQKEMSLNQFGEALQEIAVKIFTSEYDRQFNTAFGGLSAKEKTVKFLEKLGFDDIEKVKKILKNTHRAFHINSPSRITDSDPSRRYRLDIGEHQLKKRMVEQ